MQKVLNEVRSEVDRIPSFPELAEEREVKQITMREPVIQVGIIGPDQSDPESELRLRDVAERVREDLLQQPAVSQATIAGAREYQIDVEIPEETLRKYGLSLKRVADIIRRENVEIPGGTMRTDAQEVLLRGKNKRTVGEDLLEIPLVTAPGGVVLRVGDLGTVRDEFDDTITSISRINGRPGLVISVERTSSEDLLAMVADVRRYVAEQKLPPGYEMTVWGDQSIEVADRLNMLAKNGLQGLILVFLLLALFLELRLAFWVALGIPVAILGTCAVLFFGGHTLNMLTSFAFLMVLGILVDDAIVIGENVHAHRQRGKGFLQAAIDGTYEVLPSVTASVATTVIAFIPLLYVAGVMGKFLGVMPVAVIAALLISLLEATFVLPCHLAHAPASETLLERTRRWRAVMSRNLRLTLGNLLVALGVVWSNFAYPFRRLGDLFAWLNIQAARLLDAFIARFYRPTLRWAIDHADISILLAVSLLLVSVGLVVSGHPPFNVFPQIDSKQITSRIMYPDGTPAAVTDAATAHIEAAIHEISKRYEAAEGKPVVQFIHKKVGQVSTMGSLGPDTRTSGSHVGGVDVELVDSSERNVRSDEIIAEWRKLLGHLPRRRERQLRHAELRPRRPADRVQAAGRHRSDGPARSGGRGNQGQARRVRRRVRHRRRLAPGKWEFQLRVKPNAMAMGIPLADLAETVRGSYYGEEVMRVQRGRHEVKLMVRYPQADRRSLADFEEIRVRTFDGAERPITELADIHVERGYSEINRIEQKRSITITADVDEAIGNAYNIVSDLRASFMPDLFKRYPELGVLWQGQQERTTESMDSLLIGLLVALIAMFVLLTVEFRSYLQPLLIMAIIPFGVIGAVWGHLLHGHRGHDVQLVRRRGTHRRGGERLDRVDRFHQPSRARRAAAQRSPGRCRRPAFPAGALDQRHDRRRIDADPTGALVPGAVGDSNGHEPVLRPDDVHRARVVFDPHVVLRLRPDERRRSPRGPRYRRPPTAQRTGRSVGRSGRTARGARGRARRPVDRPAPPGSRRPRRLRGRRLARPTAATGSSGPTSRRLSRRETPMAHPCRRLGLSIPPGPPTSTLATTLNAMRHARPHDERPEPARSRQAA